MAAYSVEVERKRKRLYDGLSEKDRRRSAAVEVAQLGHGRVESISRVWGCDPKTIRPGMKELEDPEDPAVGRVRKKGVADEGWSSRVATDAGGESEATASGIHGGRSAARRRVVDEPVAARIAAPVDRLGNSGQSPRDSSFVATAPDRTPHGTAEEHEGTPSRPQRSV